jgi:hypothetical protein
MQKLPGGGMRPITIQEAQEYLTVRRRRKKKRIINIANLLKRHPPDKVLDFLYRYQKEQEKTLKHLMTRDKTRAQINDLVSTMFRVKMAIHVIERGDAC